VSQEWKVVMVGGGDHGSADSTEPSAAEGPVARCARMPRVPPRMSSPTFVGRAPELALLSEALAAAPGAAFIGGEAGVGKSRLAEEFLRSVGPGTTVLRCGCLPGGRLPYAPIVQALESLESQRAGAVLPRLTDDGGERSEEPRLSSDVARLRLFVQVVSLLEELSPVVLLVEDLHWADASTLDLLDFVVRRMDRSAVLVVGTYRDDLPGDAPLRAMLAEFRRMAGPVRAAIVSLPRFTADESRELVTGILRAPPPAGLVQRLFDRSEGNAFLIEELVAAGDSAELPALLRDVLLARARGLAEPARLVLLAAAVTGRRVAHATLAAVTGLPEPDLLAAIREVVDRGILVPAAEGYAFRHALVAEAILDEALPGDRIRLHSRLADTLEPREVGRDAAYWARVAHHRLAAGQSGPALVASAHAGLAAERIVAPVDARAHFERAARLWHEAPDAHAESPLDLAGLYRHAADAAHFTGDHEAAVRLIARGIAHATDRTVEGLMQERYGRYLISSFDRHEDAIVALRRAVDLVPDEPTTERASVLAGLAAALMVSYRHREAFEVCDRALVVIRRAGAREHEPRVLSTMGMGLVVTGEITRGIALMTEALQAAEQLELIEQFHLGCINLSDALRGAARFRESAELALKGWATAKKQGVHHTWGDVLIGNAIDALMLLGHWDEVSDLLSQLPGSDEPMMKVMLWCGTARLSTARGQFDEAAAALSRARQGLTRGGNPNVRTVAAVDFAAYHLWRGQPAEALRCAQEVTDVLTEGEYDSYGVHLIALALRAIADQPGLQPPPTPDYTALIADPPDYVRRVPEAAAYLALAEAELTRIRWSRELRRPDPEVWARVAAGWAALECPYHRAYALWREAQATFEAGGHRSIVTARLDEVAGICASLGAVPLRREVDMLRARVRAAPAAPPGETQTRAAGLGLTLREADVLKLLATGFTNRQIARSLNISESTVSIHVTRILSKLKVPNRSAAAIQAYRHGLIAAPPAIDN
jgi:DNA-binding CsgD family transcriptional regulator